MKNTPAAQNCFTAIDSNQALPIAPDSFTYAFCYQPHELSKLASKQLQQYLITVNSNPQAIQGKMYGVLVVENKQGQLGFLAGVSGTISHLNDANEIEINQEIKLVPNIFSGFDEADDYHKKHQQVNDLNENIATKQNCNELAELEKNYAEITEQSTLQIASLKKEMTEAKKIRKLKRADLAQSLDSENETLNPEAFEKAQLQSIDLARQSVEFKKQLTALKRHWKTKVDEVFEKLESKKEEINQLIKQRSELSTYLQKQVFQQYQLKNILGQTKDLVEIFNEADVDMPPSGSGDCALPKLLQYAFLNEYTPICMAEFWWGKAPKSEVRKHENYYPSCKSKCVVILSHMLKGLKIEANPLLENPAKGFDLEVVYSDEHLVVVNKPSGMLSVPGKVIKDCVYSRIKELYPQAKGGLIVHRLDMATSGLLVLALNEKVHKKLQQQFIKKEIEKRYVAKIEGVLEDMQGKIIQPLILDVDDRPRQMINEKWGKYAETHYEVISKTKSMTKVYLYPITGRTHQLRVHCAHQLGLNMPIIGDDLYGTAAERLYLHAQKLVFTHPITKEKMHFEKDAEF